MKSRKRILSPTNRAKIERGLSNYLDGLLAASQHSYRTAYRSAIADYPADTPKDACRCWLEGLPLAGVAYYNAEIVQMCLSYIGDGRIKGCSLYETNLHLERHYIEAERTIVECYWEYLAYHLALQGSRRF